MRIGVDINQLTGSHALSNAVKHRQMARLGAELVPLRLPFGDYVLITDDMQAMIDRKGLGNIHKRDLAKYIRVSIDTKKDLNEVCGNVCQGHERFKRELLKPMQQANARLVLLIEEGAMQSVEDVYFWDNPRLAKNPKATNGTALYKSLCTIKTEYNVDIHFCSRNDAGRKIIEILGGT